ncbi:malolactic fermentation transcriptional regulator [Weissella viridescens]|jgi:DNA-binding transcriptional LysR family regulator|uniref:Malolactic fermentation transcriptional regulator n=2 Tax=Weissella viridescens TaxID=1629 RepID=A0A0R2H207_WEIVI|nr:malolactic fermentation transcriptional regulator [Weissella viridescens]
MKQVQSMNMNDLSYFIDLAETHSFTAVAKHFDISQPSVTYAIKRLEEHFEAQLINRDQSHKTISLTPAGSTLYLAAQKIVAEYHFAQSEIKLQTQQKLTLGLPPIIATYYAPKLSHLLLEHNLLEHVQTIENGSIDLINKVSLGQLDMALIGAPTPPTGLQNVQCKQISAYPFVLITADQTTPDQLSFKELDQQKFILLNESFVHNSVFTQLSENSGVHPSISYQTSNLTLLKDLVRQHGGMSFITTLALTDADQDLKQIKLTDVDLPTFNIYAVSRIQEHADAMTRELEGLINHLD